MNCFSPGKIHQQGNQQHAAIDDQPEGSAIKVEASEENDKLIAKKIICSEVKSEVANAVFPKNIVISYLSIYIKAFGDI